MTQARTVREILKAGAAAGLIGGCLMAAWSTLYAAGTGAGFLFPLRLVGTTFFGERALVGGPEGPLAALLLHLALSAVYGVVFTAFLGRFARARFALPAGLMYGLLVFFFMTEAVLPWANPGIAAEVRHVPTAWLIGHLLFGIGVASGPALRRNLMRGTRVPLRTRQA